MQTTHLDVHNFFFIDKSAYGSNRVNSTQNNHDISCARRSIIVCYVMLWPDSSYFNHYTEYLWSGSSKSKWLLAQFSKINTLGLMRFCDLKNITFFYSFGNTLYAIDENQEL